jgi:hypothetical protein
VIPDVLPSASLPEIDEGSANQLLASFRNESSYAKAIKSNLVTTQNSFPNYSSLTQDDLLEVFFFFS